MSAASRPTRRAAAATSRARRRTDEETGPMQVVVTGGSGKLGRAVIDELIAHGHDVANVVRAGPRLADRGTTTSARAASRDRQDPHHREQREDQERKAEKRAPYVELHASYLRAGRTQIACRRARTAPPAYDGMARGRCR